MARRTLRVDGELREDAFLDQVVGLFRAYQWPRIFHAPQQGQRSDKRTGRYGGAFRQVREGRGFPDLLAIKGSRIVVAELKGKGGSLRDGQADWIEAFTTVGQEIAHFLEDEPLQPVPSVEAYLWTPDDFDELHDVIRGAVPRRHDLDPLEFSTGDPDACG